jgi:putative NIF3 family GTP cyclohydrolase 1 type 2
MITPLLFALLMLAAAFAARAADNAVPAGPRPTARQLVERIKENVQCEWSASTVDTFKAGDPDTAVSGIATTFMASLDVLQRAAASGKNFVITHEPTFYNHFEKTDAIEGDKVLAEKRAFIEKHGMVVWRFHDHWHRRQPDGISQGMARQLGWDKYRSPDDPALYELPETTLRGLAEKLKDQLGASVVRVVGKPKMKVRVAALLPGAGGSVGQIRMLQRDDVEVVLAGETPEWETVEYVRDAVTAGKAKALVLLGHANSEEAGMENCAAWLKGFIAEVPVEFIRAGDPFWPAK